MQRKVAVDGIFVRKVPYEYKGDQFEADIKNGDTITILSEGKWTPSRFEDGADQYVISIDTRNGAKNLAINQTTINVLIDEFGEDSKAWVGKELNVIMKKDIVAKKKVEIVYLVTAGYSLDEYGSLVKEGEGVDEDPGIQGLESL